MTTKAQRARVILALDCLASQETPQVGAFLVTTLELLGPDSEDNALACRAWREAVTRKAFGVDVWRHHYAEAAQLIREGTVR